MGEGCKLQLSSIALHIIYRGPSQNHCAYYSFRVSWWVWLVKLVLVRAPYWQPSRQRWEGKMDRLVSLTFDNYSNESSCTFKPCFSADQCGRPFSWIWSSITGECRHVLWWPIQNILTTCSRLFPVIFNLCFSMQHWWALPGDEASAHDCDIIIVLW